MHAHQTPLTRTRRQGPAALRYSGVSSQVYRCTVCGEIFATAHDAHEHVKERHYFPEL
ncbi:hypothetical protein H4R18_005468 [Coemansia javaensis]|uniref:C2H2-type domain-containing protein n=1 Tax=Coemansia javaensis TaxID=2761396 RepID=A0A9W8H4Z4_9FUNG|nr:hypothetical protein H4R18_005468 [Coemansia javaensis]